MPVISDVFFAYVKLQSPVKKYQSTDTEFSLDVVVSKAQAKVYNREFTKQKAKEIDNEDFKEQFKFDPPFPEQDEQYVVRFKRAHTKNGKELPSKYRPRVIMKGEDGGNVDVTFDLLVANGSKGKVAYNIQDNDFGHFHQLSSIFIEDLIEYKSGAAGEEFGKVSLKDVPQNQQPVVKQEDALQAKVSERAAKEEFEDDSIPF